MPSEKGQNMRDNEYEENTRNGLESMPPATDEITPEDPQVAMFLAECKDFSDRKLLERIYVSQRQTQTVVEGIIAQAQANPMISGMLGL